MRSGRCERGFLLAASVVALVVIAALITGVLFAARQEMKIGRNSFAAQHAFSAADAGLSRAIADWNLTTWNGLANNATASLSGSLPRGTGSWTGTIRRLNAQLFFIQVTGMDAEHLSSRTLGAVSRLLIMPTGVRAAITARGGVKIGGSSFISGVDRSPSGWSCPPAGDTVPGIATRDRTQVGRAGCASAGCIQGKPEILQDTTISDSTGTRFGELSWDDLASMASVVYSTSSLHADDIGPVGTATSCNTSVKDNWGDPMSPPSVAGCAGYFPVIYVDGDFVATGGYGQGTLIVNGNLSVQGQFQFFGPVIVRGNIMSRGAGGRFTGALVGKNIDLQPDAVLGYGGVAYSSCALFKAAQAHAPGRWIRQRSWMELF